MSNYLCHFLEFVETQLVSVLCLFNFHIRECSLTAHLVNNNGEYKFGEHC
jgi:hypothetical protein